MFSAALLELYSSQKPSTVGDAAEFGRHDGDDAVRCDLVMEQFDHANGAQGVGEEHVQVVFLLDLDRRQFVR